MLWGPRIHEVYSLAEKPGSGEGGAKATGCGVVKVGVREIFEL